MGNAYFHQIRRYGAENIMNDMQTRFLHWVVSMLMYIGAVAATIMGLIELAFVILGVGIVLWFIVLSLGELDQAKHVAGMQILLWGFGFGTLCVLFLGSDFSTFSSMNVTATGLSTGIGIFILTLMVAMAFWQQATTEDQIAQLIREKNDTKNEIKALQKQLKQIKSVIHG